MNAKQTRLARQLLGLNQTEFASLLGWTSKRNIVNLERGDKEVMTQTALAIECLLRRNNKYRDFEMIERMQPVLDFILAEIKRVNSSRKDEATISDDESNQELVDIFHDAANKFTDIDFDLVDDEDALIALFGYAGFCEIREAEQGRY
jgi:DNA-binding XRE family transcriptional regulator